MQLISTEVIPTLILIGAINWLVTVIFVSNKVFEDVRELFEKAGSRIEEKHPRIGPKLAYFCKCYMCAGVWIGFAQYAAFGGPLHTNPAWAAFIANGLMYKAIGHLILQLSELMHSRIELNGSSVKLGKQTYLEREALLERSAPAQPAAPSRNGHDPVMAGQNAA